MTTIFPPRRLLALLLLFAMPSAALAIPAVPLMTLYQFNGKAEGIPFYDAAVFRRNGASSPAGYLAQGTAVIPCLVLDRGRPLTDGQGTPYVGFKVVMDARTATPGSAERLRRIAAQRKTMSVANHHCKPGMKRVIDARRLIRTTKFPHFDPPSRGGKVRPARALDETDRIIRRFHDSRFCAQVNGKLVDRRKALQRAWNDFARENGGKWPRRALQQARTLDFVMRTVLFEGHLDRGCNAYGVCERNVIALSIRNRALGACVERQGCRRSGDFEGVASKESQYNIWDAFLTQISGLTSCFLRSDLGRGGGEGDDHYRKLQGMYAQSYPDVKRILYGGEGALRRMFPGVPMSDLKALRHYYHPPAMGKCFPGHDRVEYITGAVAWKAGNFALIANTLVRVGNPAQGGYYFRELRVDAAGGRDRVRVVDAYPGFVLDKRKVKLKKPRNCTPYGVSKGCGFREVGRYRKVPAWLRAGKPLQLACTVRSRGSGCDATPRAAIARVGGPCDTEMMPVSGVR